MFFRFMKAPKEKNATAGEVRARLVELGGRTAQDLGIGRILGQMLVYLYLRDGECSLDEIGADLGLSKAAVSVAARQLEGLGLIRRIWKQGDRRSYYRTADDIGTALRQGLLALVRRKIDTLGAELDQAHALLAGANGDPDLRFLAGRVKRAKVLRDRAAGLLNSRLLGMFMK